MSTEKLPKGWVNTTIENISEKCSQRVPLDNEEFIYVDIGSINRELKLIENPQYLYGKNAPSRARKVIKVGDVIVSLTRPNLNAVALVNEKYDDQIASTGFEVIHPIKVQSKYIFGLVRSRHFIDTISGFVQGALYPAAKSRDVQSYEFPLPPLAEQKIIAEKLDTLLAQVDTTKARLEQIPQILKRFRQAVLSMAISGKLTEEWRRNSNTDLSKWVNSNIGELAQVATGKTPKRTEITYWENGSIPWLTSSSTGRPYVEQAEQFITLVALKECILKIFPPGTLLLAMYGEGKTRGQVTELKISATCNQACASIICNKEKVDLQFLKMRLMENYEETRKAAAGGNQPNLNLNKVREIPVLVPPLPEQQEIVRSVEQLFAYADTIEKQVNNALVRVNNLTQSILAKAFRGELTAQWRAENPDLISGENSAAALLEKIKAERAASGSKKVSRKKK
ncbi:MULTISPECIES: restriction endonuclease subunit S [unclassified Providencia]|uniref:restriction endonuclease subunit S n=1 Tax=unclassified Providencia TaxID=2633465 RepID=UPI0023495B0B|nr:MULTISPECIES: restriction endonuclease subunit S [unclassified Providencia]